MGKNAWEKQNELVRQKPISYEDMYSFLAKIENERDRALLTITYLTAGRCSEIVRGSTKNVNINKLFTPLKIKVIISEKKQVKVLLFTIPNKKNRRVGYKDIPIVVDKELKFIDLFKDYVRNKGLTAPNAPLFSINRHRAYQIINKYGFNPHYLRHLRLTHKASIEDYSDQKLKLLAGWTDSRPAKHYIHLNWEDLI
jgi:integrase